jgi:L-arabinose isomerase
MAVESARNRFPIVPCHAQPVKRAGYVTMPTTTPVRIGYLSAFFDAYDDVMGPGFRQTQAQAVARNRAVLERGFQVVDLGMVSSPEEAAGAAQRIAAVGIEALVYAPAMVAPPAWIEVALRDLPCPVLIWSPTRQTVIPASLDHLQATVHTSLVGATMLSNCLVRRRQRFAVIDAAPDNAADEARLKRIVTAAVAAHRLGTAVALRVGTPIAGYRDVESTTEELGALGIREIAVSVAELEAAFAGVPSAEVDSELESLRSRPGWSTQPAATAASSARLAMALRRLTREHGATLGTVNCHSCWFRQNQQIGIVACLGVSMLHEAGIPFSCTGDLPAAMAGLLAKTLSGTSLYCELYVREPASDEFLIAAGGEGDPLCAAGGHVTVLPNKYYPGRCGAGLGVRFALQQGPATLISMTPTLGDWRLIWATGAITGRSFPQLDGPNGMFRFATRPGQLAAEEWIGAGPTHHPALALGHLELELPIVARLAQLESVRV